MFRAITCAQIQNESRLSFGSSSILFVIFYEHSIASESFNVVRHTWVLTEMVVQINLEPVRSRFYPYLNYVSYPIRYGKYVPPKPAINWLPILLVAAVCLCLIILVLCFLCRCCKKINNYYKGVRGIPVSTASGIESSRSAMGGSRITGTSVVRAERSHSKSSSRRRRIASGARSSSVPHSMRQSSFKQMSVPTSRPVSSNAERSRSLSMSNRSDMSRATVNNMSKTLTPSPLTVKRVHKTVNTIKDILTQKRGQ